MNYFRFLLFPFSILYACITLIRNFLYDKKFKQVYEIPVKSIVIGNLSMGGTGKSPHTHLLASHFIPHMNVAILSRGYGRKTKGYVSVNQNHNAQDVGDEPLMYAHSFHNKVAVAVCEKRKIGVEKLIKQGNPKLIILDDAFQHRAVKGGLSIVLTEFSLPYFNDFILPVGNLRETKNGIQRADICIVTKCPDFNFDKKTFYDKIRLNKDSIFFSSIHYLPLRQIAGSLYEDSVKNVLLVTGIANPKPLFSHLSKDFEVEQMIFSDHHQFTKLDLIKIQEKFDTFAPVKKVIITTEKDYMRLVHLFDEIEIQIPWFIQPIGIKIDREKEFFTKIEEYVGTI
jgi:tetraacyldisaccharide 4'-kinase